MIHHRLDPYPIPKDRTPFFVNEPALIDKTFALLESIPDGCAEMFPFELIDELKEEYR